ncbi:efflux RND transporter periplasmic adaptor subunit [Aureimonas psammosilenae]|uniref:efflux RND transporter periplasmic adaptor subunit n=1 Tax=Aureimonas psammosilenae TaxID=2495496 RepID=UPI0012613643|nr:efflux RND transporter periplasmic adaptor subunit [Aureimonas psammosilenae]
MAFLKQISVTFGALLIGVLVWMAFDARPARFALNVLPEDAGFLRRAVLKIAPDAGQPEPTKIGATKVEGGGNRQRATIIVAGRVGEASTRTVMRAIGTGEAEHSVVVYPDTTGLIESVNFQSGQEIAGGATLAILESDTERLAVDRARIALDAAEEKFTRYQQLAKSLAVTSVEANDMARARDNARLDLRAAEVALGKRTVVAPLDGHVGIVNVDPGDLVSSSTTIATIDDRRRLRVIFHAPEGYVGDLKLGAPVEAVPTARPEKSYAGTISAIDSRLDEASRTLRVEAILDNAADELRPGMSFTITMTLPGESLLAVDPLAVQWERDGAFVWKVVNNKVEKAPVRIAERNIDSLLLQSDALALGDVVVVEGVQSVREGGSVEIRGVPQVPAPPLGEDGVPAAESAAPAEAGKRAETRSGEVRRSAEAVGETGTR